MIRRKVADVIRKSTMKNVTDNRKVEDVIRQRIIAMERVKKMELDETDKKILGVVKKVAGIIVTVIVLIALLFNTFFIVPAGYRGVLLTFGKANIVPIGEGLGIKIPFVQSIVKMSIQTQKYEADASAASKDLQIVSAKITTNYHLMPEKVPEIYTGLGLSYAERVIQPMEQEVVKANTAKFTAEELITKREDVRQDIKMMFTERLRERGIIVEELSIVNFDFSESFNNAIEAKVTAEQNALAAKNKLEQIKFEAQQAEAAAIGQKNAAIAQAQGQAESIKLIDEQLRKSPQYLEYYKLQKWDGLLPKVTGGAIPFITVT